VPGAVTDKVPNDSDDPAIWYNATDPSASLILGTDKGDTNGGIFVFDLDGKLLPGRSIDTLLRPNNIDVEYGMALQGGTVDIAVFAERGRNAIRVLLLPDMAFIDNGGIPVFVGDSLREPMGIALYRESQSGNIYAMVSRKTGPDGAYLAQLMLMDSAGVVTGREVRRFGAFKGGKEIEAIAVDDAAGFVYYSDEGAGVRKYHAHPDSHSQELALFATEDFADDHEGISIFQRSDGTGYILVSDQGNNRFHVFSREGRADDPHRHELLTILPFSTNQSDGSEVTAQALGSRWPQGLFVAMSDDRTFQLYDWKMIEDRILDDLNKKKK